MNKKVFKPWRIRKNRDRMLCEICGKRKAKGEVSIEGAIIQACNICIKSSQVERAKPQKPFRFSKKDRIRPIKFEEEKEVVEGYGKLIREARRKKGLSIEELAKKINEKASYLNHVEKEEMLPDEKLVRKLERFLGIKLEKKVEVEVGSLKPSKKSSQTLEDIAEIEGNLWE